MSEEEIIKNIKHYLNITEYYRKQEYENFDTYIQGLLDLYNKEKQNYELLLNGYNERVKEIQKLEQELEQEKEKNKELQYYMKEYLIPKSTIKLVYISKNKIKEFKDLLLKELDRDFVTEEYRQLISCYFDNLLKENNNE